MAITQIQRDWGSNPCIVRIVTTDSLATITTSGYLTAQATAINAINFGAFQWQANDIALIAYNGGSAFFDVDYTTNFTFSPQGAATSQTVISSAQIKTMYTTPVLVIPAPGAGKIIVIDSISATYLYLTAQYTGGGAIGLERGAVAALAGPAASSTLAAATFNAYTASNNFVLTPDNTDTLANSANLGIYISNDTAVFATGAGSLLLNVNYHIANAA